MLLATYPLPHSFLNTPEKPWWIEGVKTPLSGSLSLKQSDAHGWWFQANLKQIVNFTPSSSSSSWSSSSSSHTKWWITPISSHQPLLHDRENDRNIGEMGISTIHVVNGYCNGNSIELNEGGFQQSMFEHRVSHDLISKGPDSLQIQKNIIKPLRLWDFPASHALWDHIAVPMDGQAAQVDASRRPKRADISPPGHILVTSTTKDLDKL